MARRFESLDWREFCKVVQAFPFRRTITEVHLHHTWRPRQRDYRGVESILGMWRHHTQENGWSDIAQHVSIAPDGTIWLGRNFNWAPASAKGFNGNGRSGPFMIEMIGDFDHGQEQVTPRQKEATVAVIKSVQERFVLKPDALRFHKEMSSKSCPGETNDKKQWIRDIAAFDTGNKTGAARSSPFEESATRAWQLVRAMAPDSPQSDLDAVILADHPVGLEILEGAARGDGGKGRGGLTGEMLAELADHVINLEMGQFSDDGLVATDKGDVDHLFDELLPRFVAGRGHSGKAKLLFYAHGGLVSETNALIGAFNQLKFWRANGVYPVFFIWETGLAEIIRQLLTTSSSRALGPRGQRGLIGDFVIEELARASGGVTIWSGMKRSAEVASADGGGAAYVAQRASKFLDDNKKDVEIHAIGHSAGAIFQTHFMERLASEGGKVKSAHFLAPAMAVALFNDCLSPLLNKAVGSLSIFTMRKQLERNDNVALLYRKSLLYLVSNALEPRRDEPILGLEVALRADGLLRKIFGLDGSKSNHDVVWSRSDATSTGDGSSSTTHGGFDDDPATMESIARRILRRRNGEPIEPFPAPSRAGVSDGYWNDQAEMPETLQDYLIAIAADPQAIPLPPPSAPGAPITIPEVTRPGATAIQRRLALCIGIDNYRYISGLNGCINDANVWCSTLTRLGYSVTTLHDVDAATIRNRVSQMIADARPGDSLVLQFSGHGTQFDDRDGDEEDGDTPGRDECICAVDCGGTAADGLVIDDEFHAMFSALPVGAHLTSFFDCCHSGTMNRLFLRQSKSRDKGDRRARFVTPTTEMWTAYGARLAATRAVRQAAPATKRDVQYAACRSDELAYEQAGQGDFTRNACQILAGEDAAALTNSDFRDRVVMAFGSGPRQNPGVHCDASLLQLPFLQLRS